MADVERVCDCCAERKLGCVYYDDDPDGATLCPLCVAALTGSEAQQLRAEVERLRSRLAEVEAERDRLRAREFNYLDEQKRLRAAVDGANGSTARAYAERDELRHRAERAEAERDRLRSECAVCEKCGHVQAEPNWCHECGHRTTPPVWAKPLLDAFFERNDLATRAARAEAALRILADRENWSGDPLSHDAMLLGHFTPYELACGVLASVPSSLDASKQCARCGYSVADDWTICAKCGQPVDAPKEQSDA